MSNPTPTTLRETLKKYSAEIIFEYNNKGKYKKIDDQATQSIQELIDEARIDEAHRAWTMIGNSHKGITANKLLKMQYERLTELKKGL